MHDRHARFVTCLHEAAHLAVARRLNGWSTTCRAAICHEARGGGVAEFPAGLSATATAIATAAGDHGGRLGFAAPARRRRRLPPPETAEGIRARAVEASRPEAVSAVHCRAIRHGTDAERVARFAVSRNPENPDEWKELFDHVHAEAAALVKELRGEIYKLAVTLFHCGRAEIPGNPAHDEYFSGAVAGE